MTAKPDTASASARPIVHTTDLVGDDGLALAHGVALAHAAGIPLISLHANADPTLDGPMPDIHALLSHWGLAPDAVEHQPKVHQCCDEPIETLLDALSEIEPALVIATAHHRSALARLFRGSRAEAIAHNVRAPVLLLPAEARGFVDPASGRIDLHRVLVPMGDTQEAERGVQTALDLLRLAGVTEAELVLMRVHDPVGIPPQLFEPPPGLEVTRLTVDADEIESAIVEQSRHSCVVVMATRGPDSVGDMVLGSHTDRVLHRSACPIVSVRV